MGAQNQSARPTQLETLLFARYHLNSTYKFQFYCISVKYFCNDAFVV